MGIIKKLYLIIKRIPYGTQQMEYDFKKFIIKKNDKVQYKTDKNYLKNVEYIKKYGNILSPVTVSKADFSQKYVIRNNIMGYYALQDSHMKNIPIVII